MENVFVHFFNDQMLKNYGIESKELNDYQVVSLDTAFKACILVSNTPVIVPSIDLIESYDLLSRSCCFRELINYGAVTFTGSEVNPEKIIVEKQKHFKGTLFYPRYFDSDIIQEFEEGSKYIHKRLVSTTNDLFERWQQLFANNQWESNRLLKIVFSGAKGRNPISTLVDELFELPTLLEGRAFLWDILISIDALKMIKNTKEVDNAARILLGQLWIISHLEEFGSGLFYDFPGLGKLDCGLSFFKGRYELYNFRSVFNAFQFYGLDPLLTRMRVDQFWELKSSGLWQYIKERIISKKISNDVIENGSLYEVDQKWLNRKNTFSIVNRYPTFKQVTRHCEMLINLINGENNSKIYSTGSNQVGTRLSNRINKSMDRKDNGSAKPKVFIVHGWKHDIRVKLALYLEKDLRLETVVMQDEPFQGKTLPEKFESLAASSDFAIILATADEELIAPDGSKIHRMRPNVLLEIGFFWGILGRERVVLLIEPDVNVEIPTDLQGMGYHKISTDFDAVKHRVYKELKASGLIT